MAKFGNQLLPPLQRKTTDVTMCCCFQGLNRRLNRPEEEPTPLLLFQIVQGVANSQE
jgi:hypothetical protein